MNTALLIWSIVDWAIRIGMIPVILHRRHQPSTALAYLALIFAIPIVGVAVYFLLAFQHLGRRRRRTHERYVGATRARQQNLMMDQFLGSPQVGPEQRNMVIQAQKVSGNPIVTGSDVELLGENPGVFDRLISDIDRAQHHVHMIYYIFWSDPVTRGVIDALNRATKRGVQVRVLADAVGSRPLFRHGDCITLRDGGVKLCAALPVTPWRRRLARLDLRNHRKLAVIDGRLAYCGSHNVVGPTYGGLVGKRTWKDLTGRFTGPVVNQLQLTFLDDWAFETGEEIDEPHLFPDLKATGETAMQVVPTGPTHETETFRRVMLAALYSARKQIIITTPYLVPDEPTLLALYMAASRGVDVQIVAPRRTDHRMVDFASHAYYDAMMDNGVTVHTYRKGILHAKTISVDHAFAMLGSANLDIRSFDLNFEMAVLMYGAQITNQLRAVQEQYIADSERVDRTAWNTRPVLRRYLENAAALLSPLM